VRSPLIWVFSGLKESNYSLSRGLTLEEDSLFRQLAERLASKGLDSALHR
jgi:hypothetical protein